MLGFGKHREERPNGVPAAGLLRRLREEREEQENTTGQPLGTRRERPHSRTGWWPSRGH